ncbi:MAG: hypothetical protein ACRCXA_09495, partial [Peptostreptococcaceae bacterium]
YIILISVAIYAIYLITMAYLIGVKGNLNLIYSIDQVEILQYDSKKRIKISRCIGFIYLITSIGLIATGWYFIT